MQQFAMIPIPIESFIQLDLVAGYQLGDVQVVYKQPEIVIHGKQQQPEAAAMLPVLMPERGQAVPVELMTAIPGTVAIPDGAKLLCVFNILGSPMGLFRLERGTLKKQGLLDRNGQKTGGGHARKGS